MRNWLAGSPKGTVFKSYNDTLDHCCFAWNKITGTPSKIMSIGRRERAHGSSSMRSDIIKGKVP
jgi:hypothetical protein